jgi:hypothetical protein
MGIEQIRAIKLAAGTRVRTRAINPVAPKRKDENKEYEKKKAKFLKKHPVCQFPKCDKKSCDTHHMEGRSGKNFLDDKTWKALCRAHHIYCELNPKKARELNMSGSRLKKATTKAQ